MTQLEAEKESKKRAAEELEKIEALGQKSEVKAARESARVNREEEIAQQQIWEHDMSHLNHLKKNKVEYNRYLTQVLLSFATLEDIPRKYAVEIEINDIGIVLKLKGTKYVGAFKTSGLPSYDWFACKILATKLGNTVAKLQGYRPQSEGGIILVDSEDIKKYGRDPKSKP